jgi:hypothetical protein
VVENMQTSERQTIATGLVFDPRFSHDGRFLYFLSEGIVVRRSVNREGDQYVLGDLEKIAFEPYSHIHYAPGLGDTLAYTASPTNARDSAEPYKVILNYHTYLDQVLSK